MIEQASQHHNIISTSEEKSNFTLLSENWALVSAGVWNQEKQEDSQ